jgi:YidC/Oxa1 family membrane protein insertase
MDKRSLLFVVCVSAALFVVNGFFTYKDEETQRQQLATQEKKKEQQLQVQKANVEARTASLSDLDAVSLYTNASEEEFLSSAVKVQGGVLTLAWADSLPNEVFADGKAYYLRAGDTGKGDPVLYLSKGEETIPVATVPQKGKTDLQFIELSAEKKRPLVILGEWKENTLSFPLHQRLDHAALVMVKQEGRYLPYAVYEATGRSLQELSSFKDMSGALTLEKRSESISEATTQEYFVLENDTIQLVLTNLGGAVSEINLPFHSEKNTESVVRPVELDAVMQEKHAYNDYYPSHPYYTPDAKKTITPQLGGYFPLLRRDIFNEDGNVVWKINPKHYAFNVVSEYPEVSQLLYKVVSYDKKHISFEATQQQRRITKTYRLPDNPEGLPYVYDVSVTLEGDNRGLWINSGVPSVDLMSGSPSFQMKYRSLRDGKAELKSIDLPKDVTRIGSDQPNWISNASGFFGLIIDPVDAISKNSFGPMGFKVVRVPGVEVPSRLVLVDREYNRYPAQDFPGYEVQLPLVEVDKAMHFRMFAGPYDGPILQLVDSTLQSEGLANPNYTGSQNFQGWFSFISEPFAKFLLVLMKFFFKMTHSWAFSIILLTVALRLMLFPLNSWSMKSMRRMQQISPKVQEIQKKYKKEPRKAQIEVMGLYRQYGVNPLGGCFPLLIQMPFLIGMFDLLRSTFQLRGAVFIPGWIDNLASPDVLFSWEYPIPFIGTSFHLLPILLGVVMFFQQKMTSSLPKDKSLWTDQQRQQKVMGSVMTVVFTVMFYRFPSGLNLYWLSSMLLGILQQWYINKRLGNKPLEPKNPKNGKGSALEKRLQGLSR